MKRGNEETLDVPKVFNLVGFPIISFIASIRTVLSRLSRLNTCKPRSRKAVLMCLKTEKARTKSPILFIRKETYLRFLYCTHHSRIASCTYLICNATTKVFFIMWISCPTICLTCSSDRQNNQTLRNSCGRSVAPSATLHTATITVKIDGNKYMGVASTRRI